MQTNQKYFITNYNNKLSIGSDTEFQFNGVDIIFDDHNCCKHALTDLRLLNRCSYLSAFNANIKHFNTLHTTELKVLNISLTKLLSIDIRKLACLEVLLASASSLKKLQTLSTSAITILAVD